MSRASRAGRAGRAQTHEPAHVSAASWASTAWRVQQGKYGKASTARRVRHGQCAEVPGRGFVRLLWWCQWPTLFCTHVRRRGGWRPPDRPRPPQAHPRLGPRPHEPWSGSLRGHRASRCPGGSVPGKDGQGAAGGHRDRTSSTSSSSTSSTSSTSSADLDHSRRRHLPTRCRRLPPRAPKRVGRPPWQGPHPARQASPHHPQPGSPA